MSLRRRISLDGPWQFYFDAEGDTTLAEIDRRSDWRAAVVPMPWQAQFEDLRNRGGVGWYRRTVTIDGIPADRVAFLHFGAVDYHATVWVNGEQVCEHEGGYLPFEIDITPYLGAGANRLLVRVIDPDDDSACWSPFSFSQIPHGKQSWYGQTSGIWQSVWLDVRDRRHVRRLKLTPNLSHGEIAVEAPLADPASSDSLVVTLSVRGPDGKLLAEVRHDARALEVTSATVTLDPTAVLPWSPEQPALYTVQAQLYDGSRLVDEMEDTCGFRAVEARDGRIFLNGRPLYLRGALDQAYYPETIYTPPSLDLLERQLRQAKALGFNCLRCHIKIEDPRYYALADRLGMLIWAELPNWLHWSPAAAERARATFDAMVARDWNRPSIIAWTIINEDWGTDLVHNQAHRRWLAEFYHHAKALDPTRLIVDNSPCHPNAHVISDVEDYHHYRVIPDNAAAWDAWAADFATRPDWTWSSDHRQLRKPDAPLIVSEFGNWGLPDPQRLREQGSPPWWFDTGYDWGEGIVTPRGLAQRFATWRLDRVFGSFGTFLQASQTQMARSLAYEISSLRAHAALGGYVVTELTDVHWEANGLLDFQRNLKTGVAEWVAPVNRDRAVLIQPSAWSAEAGETITVRLQAMDVDGPSSRGRLRWRAGDAAGEIAAPGGQAAIPLPAVGSSCLVSVRVVWLDGEEELAANQIELTCLAIPEWTTPIVAYGQPELRSALDATGYAVIDPLDEKTESPLLVTDELTDEVKAMIRQGARAIWLVDARTPQPPPDKALFLGDQTRIVPRDGTWRQGDWASSFSWLDKRGPFAHLPGDPMLDMAYAGIMPRSVLTLEAHRLLKQNVWAGLAVGWLHGVAGLIAYADYGRGGLVICTLRLTPEHIRTDATAHAVLRGLIELAATGGR